MTKPTRDSVEEMLNDFEAHELIGSRRDVYELVVDVFKGYISQEEELISLKDEVEEVEMDRGVMITANGRANKIIDQLQAENQALKASMEVEYIERQAKHIQALVKENMELKARLKGTFECAEPQRGRPLPYRIDEEDALP